MALAAFLLQQVADVADGGGSLGAEVADGRAEVVVEAAEGVDDEGMISDGGADMVEGVRQLLETASVLGDRHVTLVQTVELLLRVDGALEAVVEEEAGDARPDGIRREPWLVNRIHDVLGHGGVQPRDDAGIDLHPLGVVAHEDGVDGAVDVVEEDELFEEGAPLAKVRGLRFKRHGNVRLDVDHGDRRSGGWIRKRGSKGIGGGAGGGGTRHEYEKE